MPMRDNIIDIRDYFLHSNDDTVLLIKNKLGFLT